MKKFLGVITAVLLVTLFSCSREVKTQNEFGWYTNFDECKKVALQEDKRMLLLFTRDTDDMMSEVLKTSIFFTNDFKSRFEDKYLFCKLDFSKEVFEATKVDDSLKGKEKSAAKKTAKASLDYLEKNMRYASIYGASETPAIMILTKEAYFVDAITYFECKTVDEFYAELQTYEPKLEKIESLVKVVEGSKGIDKVKAIDDLYANTSRTHSYLLKDLIKQVPSLDSKNTTGLVGKYVLADASVKALDCYFARKADKAIEPYLKAAKSKYLLPAEKQQAYYAAAYTLGAMDPSSEIMSKILDYLRLAKEADPTSPLAAQCEKDIAQGEEVLKRLIDYEAAQKEAAKIEEDSPKEESGN